MPTSKTDIANLAIANLGVAKQIGDIDTTDSASASAVRLHYERSLRAALRGFEWPFAHRYRELELVEESPNDDWPFSFVYPSDCLLVRRIVGSTEDLESPSGLPPDTVFIVGHRVETNDSRIPWEVGADDNQGLIYTIINPAVMSYTKYVTNPDKYSDDFVMAFAAKLAFFIAPMLVANNYTKIRQDMAVLFNFHIGEAKKTALNERNPDPEPKSIFERARQR